MLLFNSPGRLATISLVAVLAGCGPSDTETDQVATQSSTADSMSQLVDDYLRLELSMGEHDTAHVDAYFGPAELRAQAQRDNWSLATIATKAETLSDALTALRSADNAQRIDGLLGRLTALRMRVAIVEGDAPDFDTEARALFGAVAPNRDDAYYDEVLNQIDALLSGDEPLERRVTAFREQFMIPADKLDAVFRAAMDACRERTIGRIELPENERFRIEYVTDKPWSGYNWYEGDAESLIQVNTDLPTPIDRAVDLGCHEGYPGHHTFNALVEQKFVRENGWLEYSLYPLFSPQSLIAEGTGNYGIELAFPGAERVDYEKAVLFPLAGLDVTEADRYYALQGLLGKLSFAGNEAARDLLNGDITEEEAIAWLQRYTLSSPERAAQRVRFIKTYRSYVVNYNLGQSLVAAWVERDDADADLRWARFETLLKQPVVPGALGGALPDRNE